MKIRENKRSIVIILSYYSGHKIVCIYLCICYVLLYLGIHYLNRKHPGQIVLKNIPAYMGSIIKINKMQSI